MKKKKERNKRGNWGWMANSASFFRSFCTGRLKKIPSHSFGFWNKIKDTCCGDVRKKNFGFDVLPCVNESRKLFYLIIIEVQFISFINIWTEIVLAPKYSRLMSRDKLLLDDRESIFID